MGLDELASCIERLKTRMQSHRTILEENETRTRAALIDPLLGALGWDVSDPAVVMAEYKVGNKSADYAIANFKITAQENRVARAVKSRWLSR